MTNHVLLIASPDDGEAALVRDALSKRSALVTWIDTADFPERIGLIATADCRRPGWLEVGEHTIDLRAVSAIYRRSPGVFGLDDTMSGPELRFALMEAVQGMGGALAHLPCMWMNHPARVADASYKLVQMSTARDCGLRVPATVVTNVGRAAREFIAAQDGPVIYKPMSPGVIAEDGRVKVVNATIVESDQVDDESVAKTAHLFQRFIDKRYDARVTVVGDKFFGVAIEANRQIGLIDWRADYDSLTYRVIAVPETIRDGVAEYMSRFGLNFAALDLSVDRDESWWFLEANPNGLWGWLEEAVNIPVSDAIAQYLTS